MAVADVTPGNKDAACTLGKSGDEKTLVYPSCAHEPHQTHIRRILDTGNPRQIGPAISTPVTNEGYDFRWFR
jgi:hypothetical protein